MVLEENQYQTNNIPSAESNGYMTAEAESALRKIDAISIDTLRSCQELSPKGSEKIRLQFGSHNGNSIFFNQNGSDTRFGLIDGVNGTLYLADTPQTAMKEVFQNKLSILESDLANYYMGTVVTEKDLQVLDTVALIKCSKLTLNDFTTSLRCITQAIAQKAHEAGLDGIKFLSNVTSEECLALWCNDPSGVGVVTTKSQTRLSEFEYHGVAAADILVDELGIPVEE